MSAPCAIRETNPFYPVAVFFSAVWEFTRQLNSQYVEDERPQIEDGKEIWYEETSKVHPPSPTALARYNLRPRKAVSYVDY